MQERRLLPLLALGAWPAACCHQLPLRQLHQQAALELHASW
jgi:hypothetical protein